VIATVSWPRRGLVVTVPEMFNYWIGTGRIQVASWRGADRPVANLNSP